MKPLKLATCTAAMLTVLCVHLAAQGIGNLANQYDRIFLADSLLSVDDACLKNKIGDLIIPSIKVKNGFVVTSLTEVDFADQDIPRYYFEMLQNNIGELNDWISNDKITVPEVRKMLRISKRDYKTTTRKMLPDGI